MDDIRQELAFAFAQIPAVEQVYLEKQGRVYIVTTIINDEDEAVFDLIYDRERGLIHRYPTSFFDFHVVSRRGRPVSEITGDAAPVWLRDESRNLCHAATNI